MTTAQPPLTLTLDLVLDRFYLNTVLRAIFSSIIFHRGFALTKPIEVDVEGMEITYITVDDPEIERLIDERISAFTKTLEPSAGRTQSTLTMMFLERRPKTSWFAKSNDVCWEQWVLNLTITRSRSEREQFEAKRSVEKQLYESLVTISQKCNEHKDHVPPIQTNDTYPFPFQITFNESIDNSTWTGMMKGLMAQAL